MLELAGVHVGSRVLELAAGPGGLGLVAARIVGPSGQVVISDFVHEMTSIAAARAAARGLDNVTTIELDLEQIDQPSESFDAVLCREELMLVPDPAAAMREIARVLRPGGRAMVSVWGAQDHNPWLGLIFQAVSEGTGRPTPPPGLPMPFSLGSIQQLTAIVSSALDEAAVEEHSVPLQATSFAEYWTRTTRSQGRCPRSWPNFHRRFLIGFEDGSRNS
jgi:ubiquinone/menaquinone biosynthesis C-methylase UbiE